MNPEALLFALIRSVICGKAVDTCHIAACTPENLEKVYKMAARHDLAHLVGQAVSTLDLPQSEIMDTCKQAAMAAFVRQLRLEQAFLKVRQAFETAGIRFIPLKGLILREYYPEPWMRTSSDMDILVREEDLQKATDLLKASLGYSYHKQSSHDVALISPEKVYLELHYSTIEDFISPDAHRVMSEVWETAVPAHGFTCQLEISDELFYYYHMAHAAKHFMGGGCGVRAVLDTWVLENRVDHCRESRKALLEQGGMLAFARGVEKLSQSWFDGEPPDTMTQTMGNYILTGGNFGTLENMVCMKQTKQGGKVKYALSRIFLPYHTLRYQYPILQKYKILFPFYQVVRWCKLLFKGGADRGIQELQTNANLPSGEQNTAAALLHYLQLQ